MEARGQCAAVLGRMLRTVCHALILHSSRELHYSKLENSEDDQSECKVGVSQIARHFNTLCYLLHDISQLLQQNGWSMSVIRIMAFQNALFNLSLPKSIEVKWKRSSLRGMNRMMKLFGCSCVSNITETSLDKLNNSQMNDSKSQITFNFSRA
jgi:hypothetical protein